METWRMTALFVMWVMTPGIPCNRPKLGRWIEKDGSIRVIIHGPYRQYVDSAMKEWWEIRDAA